MAASRPTAIRSYTQNPVDGLCINRGHPLKYADNSLSSVDGMWIAKKPEMNSRGTLRVPLKSDRNALDRWKRASSGGHSGTREAAGSRRFARMPGPGGWSAVQGG